MALTATVILLCLILEDHDLRGFAVFQNFTGYSCALNIGIAELGFANLAASQNTVESDGLISGDIQLFDVDDLALGHFDLLTAGLNNCVHEITSLLL